jgi:hypothetical protein
MASWCQANCCRFPSTSVQALGWETTSWERVGATSRAGETSAGLGNVEHQEGNTAWAVESRRTTSCLGRWDENASVADGRGREESPWHETTSPENGDQCGAWQSIGLSSTSRWRVEYRCRCTRTATDNYAATWEHRKMEMMREAAYERFLLKKMTWERFLIVVHVHQRETKKNNKSFFSHIISIYL